MDLVLLLIDLKKHVLNAIEACLFNVLEARCLANLGLKEVLLDLVGDAVVLLQQNFEPIKEKSLIK